jgi:hypothetical protein
MSKTLQAKGRGPDTYLVHMGPEELASMEYLANQRQLSLTVNPETGLYEVGILSSILPMVVGAAAMYFTGGAAAPWVGALAGAGTGALLNKDNRLMGALTGGLGGFAGGSLAGSLGAGAAAEGAGLAGAEAGAQAGSLLGIEGGSGFTGINALTGGAGGTSAAEAAGMMSSDALGQALQTAQASQAPLVSVPTSGMGPIGAESGYQASSLFVPQPEQSMWGKVGDWWGKKSTMEKVGIGGLGLAGIGAFAGDSNGLDEPEKQGGNYQDYEFQPAVYDPETGKSVKPARYVKKGTRAYAGGGLFENMSLKPIGGGGIGWLLGPQLSDPLNLWQKMGAVDSTRGDSPKEKEKRRRRGFTSGGVAQLSQGRMIKGPGDGLSDSIPASIDGGQQAALADGEFVVPADIVSVLGGGSTDAGARRLYKMLDQVRIAAHGHKRQMQKIPKAALAV